MRVTSIRVKNVYAESQRKKGFIHQCTLERNWWKYTFDILWKCQNVSTRRQCCNMWLTCFTASYASVSRMGPTKFCHFSNIWNTWRFKNTYEKNETEAIALFGIIMSHCISKDSWRTSIDRYKLFYLYQLPCRHWFEVLISSRWKSLITLRFLFLIN